MVIEREMFYGISSNPPSQDTATETNLLSASSKAGVIPRNSVDTWTRNKSPSGPSHGGSEFRRDVARGLLHFDSNYGVFRFWKASTC